MLYSDHIVPLRPSWCYSSHVVFRPHRSPSPDVTLLMLYSDHMFPFVHPDVTLLRPHRSPSSILMLLFSCCIQTTSRCIPFVHPVVTLLLLYLDHIVPLRPSWCYSSMLLQTTSFPFVHPYSSHVTTSFPFVHPDVTLLMLYSDHIVPLRPSCCYSSHVVFRLHRSPSSIMMLPLVIFRPHRSPSSILMLLFY